jgi:hypothetical protein
MTLPYGAHTKEENIINGEEMKYCQMTINFDTIDEEMRDCQMTINFDTIDDSL